MNVKASIYIRLNLNYHALWQGPLHMYVVQDYLSMAPEFPGLLTTISGVHCCMCAESSQQDMNRSNHKNVIIQCHALYHVHPHADLMTDELAKLNKVSIQVGRRKLLNFRYLHV